ncbi:protein ytfJ [Salmonella bongori]|nr:protein ytfJ [Salmonella bongori]
MGELMLNKDEFSYKNWNSAQLAGKVRVLQHIAGPNVSERRKMPR